MKESEGTEEITLYPYLLQGQQALPNCKPISGGHSSAKSYRTPLPHPTTPTPLVNDKLLTVVAKVFSNTLIFLLKKCDKATHIFSAKNINVLAIFQDRNFSITLATCTNFFKL